MTRMILWFLVLLPVLFSQRILKLLGLSADLAQARASSLSLPIIRAAEGLGLDASGWLAFLSRAPVSLSGLFVTAGVGSAFLLGAAFTTNVMRTILRRPSMSEASASPQIDRASLRLEAVAQRRK